MDALEKLLRPVADIVNRQIAARTPARELVAGLEGRVLGLRVSHSALAAYLVVENGELALRSQGPDDPDVVLTGSPIALARLVGPAGEELLRDGIVDMTGDAVMALQFQALLRLGKPELEEELAGLIGDSAAHGIGEMSRGLGEWLRDTRSIMRQDLAEYLKEERRVVPSRYETEAFAESIEALRDGVERLEARIARLEMAAGRANPE